MEKEILRQLIHFSGVIFVFLSFAFESEIIATICFVFFIFFVFLSFWKICFKGMGIRFFIKFADRFERPGNFPYKGAIFFFFSISLLFYFFPEEIARIACFVLCVYDSIATIVGKHIGKIRIGNKSLEGYFSGFIITTLAGALFFPFEKIFVASLFAVIAETLPYEDNLTIPFSIAFILLLLNHFQFFEIS